MARGCARQLRRTCAYWADARAYSSGQEFPPRLQRIRETQESTERGPRYVGRRTPRGANRIERAHSARQRAGQLRAPYYPVPSILKRWLVDIGTPVKADSPPYIEWPESRPAAAAGTIRICHRRSQPEDPRPDGRALCAICVPALRLEQELTRKSPRCLGRRRCRPPAPCAAAASSCRGSRISIRTLQGGHARNTTSAAHRCR